MQTSLSGQDILDICGGNSNVLKYSEINDASSLDDIMQGGACIILYETQPDYGHWCCVFIRDNGDIEYFDSYGLIPDAELQYVPEGYRRFLGECKPTLMRLIYESGRPSIYNEYHLQREIPGVNTCGRWVGLRLLLRRLSLDSFAQFFLSYPNPDEIVVKLTTP